MLTTIPDSNRNRKRSQKSGQGDTAGPTVGEGANSLVQLAGFAPPALTSLPVIHSHIPAHYVISAGVVESASVALDMLDAGLLTVTTGNLPAKMVENSMRAWFQSITKDLTSFRPHLVMTNNMNCLIDNLEEGSAEEKFDLKGDKNLSFGISFSEWEWFSLKAKIEAFEAAVPGLGETAICRMDDVLSPICQPVTPNFTFFAVQQSSWQGEDNEATVLEEYADCGEDPDDLEIITRADFDVSFPKMSYEATKRLDSDALSSLLSHSDPKVAELAALLLEVDSVDSYIKPIWPQGVAEDHLPTLYPAVCVAWSPDDLTVQIVDNYFNYECENGGTEFHTLWMFPQSAEGIVSAQQNIGEYVKRLLWVEKLLSKIATLENM